MFRYVDAEQAWSILLPCDISLVWLPLPGELLQIKTLEKLWWIFSYYSSKVSAVVCSFHFRIIRVCLKYPQNRTFICTSKTFFVFHLSYFLFHLSLDSILPLIGIGFHFQWSRSFRWRARKWKQEELFLCNHVALGCFKNRVNF